MKPETSAALKYSYSWLQNKISGLLRSNKVKTKVKVVIFLSYFHLNLCFNILITDSIINYLYFVLVCDGWHLGLFHNSR